MKSNNYKFKTPGLFPAWFYEYFLLTFFILFYFGCLMNCVNKYPVKTSIEENKNSNNLKTNFSAKYLPYKVPNGRIEKKRDNLNLSNSSIPCTALVAKEDVASWVDTHFTHYFQKYNLSCEAAIIRLVCGFWCISDLSEDNILAMMSRHSSDPMKGLVMDNIRGEAYRKDGTANWANYGAHFPIVKEVLEKILYQKKIDFLYSIDHRKIDDLTLIDVIKKDKNCLGAIIWVAAYINGEKPPQNERGQVLGEHVQFVSPVLDSKDRMLVYDVWPWKDQPFHLLKPYNRDLFAFDCLLIMKKNR